MRKYKIQYGAADTKIDVTSVVFQDCLGLNQEGHLVATIPPNDTVRARLFGCDPVPGIVKNIYIYLNEKLVSVIDQANNYQILIFTNIPRSVDEAERVLHEFHKRINLQFGLFRHEYPEQRMLCRFLPSNASVLEIGTNIGRSSLIISSLLDDDTRFVTLEADARTCDLARTNRDTNNMNFHILNKVLSTDPDDEWEGILLYLIVREHSSRSLRICQIF